MLAIDRGIARVPLPTSPTWSSHAESHGHGASCWVARHPLDARTP